MNLLEISSLLFIIIVCVYFIKYIQRNRNKNKRMILFNRRTRKFKEIYEKDFIETTTWKKVIVTNDSVFTEFLEYLMNCNVVDSNFRYKGNTSDVIWMVQGKYEEFLYERERKLLK